MSQVEQQGVVTPSQGSGIRDQESGITDAAESLPPDPQSATPEVHIDVSAPRFRLPSIVLGTIGVLSVLVLAYLSYLLLPVLLLIFVSMLFATAIEPLVNWLRRGPFNRSAGILTVYTTLFL